MHLFTTSKIRILYDIKESMVSAQKEVIERMAHPTAVQLHQDRSVPGSLPIVSLYFKQASTIPKIASALAGYSGRKIVVGFNQNLNL